LLFRLKQVLDVKPDVKPEPTQIEANNQYNNNSNISDTNIQQVEVKTLPSLNLQHARSVELKSHFDVIRKLCYLHTINAVVSVSEVNKSNK
jgi:hypothetical protein